MVVTSDRKAGQEIQAAELFLLDDPESWVESVARVMTRWTVRLDAIPAGATTGVAISAEQVFEDFQAGRLASASDRLRRISGIDLGDTTPVEQISQLFGIGDDAVGGPSLVHLLVHKLGFPPAIASLWLIGHLFEHESELEIGTDSTARSYLSGDTVSEYKFDPNMIARVVKLSASKSNAWDAVLPYLKLIVPEASFIAHGSGRQSDIDEFDLQLQSARERMYRTSPVMLQLEIAAGATERPLTQNATRLMNVLGANSWQPYVTLARQNFGTVGTLRAALHSVERQWLAIEYAPGIERAIYYLDQTDFGRVDHALAVERRVIRSRLVVETLIESPQVWLALRDEYERWRLEYRRAYLEDHSQRQARDRKLQAQIIQTDALVTQISLLRKIHALGDTPSESVETVGGGSRDHGSISSQPVSEVELALVWSQARAPFRLCESDRSDIPLTLEPVCVECRHRLGQVEAHEDIEELSTRVRQIFNHYKNRLSVIVSQLVLNSGSSDNLQKLFRLNSAGDLSDLANVLDDKVISFLNELFGNASESPGDWTSPHS